MTSKRRLFPAVLAALVLFGFCVPALSQQDGADKKPAALWEDFIHYIRRARPDAAKSYAEALLDSSVEPRELYRLSREVDRLEQTLNRGERLEGMKDVVGRIRKMIQEGFKAEASNPDEIARSIDLLGGALSQYQEGVRRLKLSGEYCLPQLLQKVVAPDTPEMLSDRIRSMLPELGPAGVRGLSAALQSSNPAMQEGAASL